MQLSFGPVLMAAAGVALLLGGWLASRRRMLLADTPRSRCAAVFVGFNEIVGAVQGTDLSPAHFTAVESAWWRATLEQEVRKQRTVHETDSKGNTTTRTEQYNDWDTIGSWVTTAPILVVDETGAATVDIARASVTVPTTRYEVTGGAAGGWFAGLGPTGRLRETEWRLVDGDRVFCAGTVSIDGEGATVVMDGRAGGEFIVTTRSETSVVRTRRLVSWFAVLAGVAAAAGAVAVAGGRPWQVVSGAAFAVAVVSVWGTVEVYNRLVRVKLLQDRALSLIDVQLARRADLLPQLVTVVRATSAHEASVLEAVAAARAAGPELAAIAERFPTLRTSPAFQALAAEVAGTETRIAAARAYCNDTITIVRDRTSTFPGLLLSGVARAGRFGTLELFALDAVTGSGSAAAGGTAERAEVQPDDVRVGEELAP